MGQGGSEPGPCRDEITPWDGEDMHGDVTRGFSSLWKHGARFTVRAAQSLFLADPAAASPPLLPTPVHSSAVCPLLSTPHSTVVVPLSGMPFPLTSCLLTYSLPHLLTHPADFFFIK